MLILYLVKTKAAQMVQRKATKVDTIHLIFMMTSSNGNIFRVTGHLCGEFTDPGEFHTQRPVTRSFDVYFDLRPNKRLSKQLWGWWFETHRRSLWRHRNVPYTKSNIVKKKSTSSPFQEMDKLLRFIWSHCMDPFTDLEDCICHFSVLHIHEGLLYKRILTVKA